MSFAEYLREQARQNEKPEYQFKTFNPYQDHDQLHGRYTVSATTSLNQWLAANPRTEIISWQTTTVGKDNELYITVQYKEKKED